MQVVEGGRQAGVGELAGPVGDVGVQHVAQSRPPRLDKRLPRLPKHGRQHVPDLRWLAGQLRPVPQHPQRRRIAVPPLHQLEGHARRLGRTDLVEFRADLGERAVRGRAEEVGLVPARGQHRRERADAEVLQPCASLALPGQLPGQRGGTAQ